MQALGSIVDLDFIPFGNAYVVVDACKGKAYPEIRKCWCEESVNKNASDAFAGPILWQHGTAEGDGNSIEACAKQVKGGNTSIAFLECFEVTHGSSVTSYEVCAASAGFTKAQSTSLKTCFTDPKLKLAAVKKAARKTCALSPQHDSTPWFVVDGSKGTTGPEEASELEKIICAAAKAKSIAPLPAVCS